MPDLTTTLGPLTLKNPTILASGIMDEDAGSIRRMITSGAGAIVTKSIGLTPRDGYPNPTIVETPHGLLNAMGLPNPGITDFTTELDSLHPTPIPLFASIYGKDPDEFQKLAKTMEQHHADALELNVSCPHAKHYGMEVGMDPRLLTDITQTVTDTVRIPVYVKLSPNTPDIISLATAAQEAGADGIIAINTLRGMSIDLDVQRPILANKIGGYSGPAIKPIGIRCVYEIAQHVTIPIIGVGGITTGADALEYIMAGASAVQIGTAVYLRGPTVFTQVTDEINSWLQTHKITKLTDVIGAALP
jgi:dihydroorotate dehydrogenase (NAD+) catalytic subunit